MQKNVTVIMVFMILHLPDINECANNNGGCEHECENNDGSYSCTCQSGRSLNDDGHSCSGMTYTVLNKPAKKQYII